MNFETYKNTLVVPPYPRKPMFPAKSKGPAATSDEIRQYADELDQHNVDLEQWKVKKKEYDEETARLHQQFKSDLFIELEIQDNPKAELLWEMAWEDGHSSGYSDVCYHAERLTQLIK